MTDSTEETTNELPDKQAILSKLATRLHEKREATKLSLEEVSYKLKIRSVYLEALETGRWEDMPEDVYALGFLRQYAAFLEENVDTELSQLKNKTIKLTRPLTFPDPSISPNKSWVIIATLAFIVLFIMLNIFHDEEVVLEPEIIQNIPQEIEPSKPVTIKPTIEPTIEAPVETPKQTEPAKASTEKTTPIPTVLGKHHYQLHAADADVWLQLSVPKSIDSPKQLIREVLLKPGEYVSVHHDSPYLLLNCGNILGLEVKIDDQTIVLFDDSTKQEKVVQNFILRAAQ